MHVYVSSSCWVPRLEPADWGPIAESHTCWCCWYTLTRSGERRTNPDKEARSSRRPHERSTRYDKEPIDLMGGLVVQSVSLQSHTLGKVRFTVGLQQITSFDRSDPSQSAGASTSRKKIGWLRIVAAPGTTIMRHQARCQWIPRPSPLRHSGMFQLQANTSSRGLPRGRDSSIGICSM